MHGIEAAYGSDKLWVLMMENLCCVKAEPRDNEFLWYGQRLGPLAGTYTMYVTTNRALG